ncbi:MAG: Gx transporter family protein [Lachnospiraceae bacterium]|nr:Gx transporter family protein [Lachnospiraceae bacterium]
MSKKIAYLAMLIALAMIFSYVEALIPINFGIPGVKLGIANIVILVGLYVLEPKDVLVISVIRIVLVGILFGNVMSITYSLAGGLFSFLMMWLIKKIKGFSIVGVSIAGGVSHNIGQLAVAILVIENIKLIAYIPVLLIAGAVTGLIIGILSVRIVPVMKKEVEKYG